MHLIVRICENEIITPHKHIRPYWYNKQKCVESLTSDLINSEDVVSGVTWLHDGAPGPLLDLFANDPGLVKLEFGNPWGALKSSFDIADKVNDDVLFVEDDYLWLPGSLRAVSKAITTLGLVSGYDAPDRYIRTDDIPYEIKIIWQENTQRHWRTAEAMTHSFGMRADMWRQWGWLFKQYEMDDRGTFRHLHSVGVPLWTPIPALCTHVQEGMTGLSYGRDWQKFSEQFEF